MNAAGAWLQAPREHPRLPVRRPGARDPTAVIPGRRGGAGLLQAALKLCRTKDAAPQGGKGAQRAMCRPGDVILGAALDHRSRSEKTSLENVSPSTGCQPARGEAPQGSGEIIFLEVHPGN